MGAMASQITSLTIVYSTVYSRADQRKHQSSTSLAFLRGIHWWLVNSPHKWPETQIMFPFDDVIMKNECQHFINILAFLFLWHHLMNKTICEIIGSLIYFEEISPEFCSHSCGCWWPSPVRYMSSEGTMMIECAMEVYGMAWLTLDRERLTY